MGEKFSKKLKIFFLQNLVLHTPKHDLMQKKKIEKFSPQNDPLAQKLVNFFKRIARNFWLILYLVGFFGPILMKSHSLDFSVMWQAARKEKTQHFS